MLSAALPAPYATKLVCTMSLDRDEMLTMLPDPLVSTIARAACRQSRNATVALKCSAVRK